MKNVKIAARETLVKNLVLLEGHTRAGKFLLGNIMDGFKKLEHFQYVSLLEQVPFLARLGFIREDAVVSLLQICVDEAVYNMRVGRNLNWRFDDASSLLCSFDRKRYERRSRSPIDPNVVNTVRKDRRFSSFVAHEVMPDIKLFFKAFPSIKVISLLRHPVDLVHSWYVRGWGEREISDPLYFQPYLAVSGKKIPWFAYRWNSEYLTLPRMDRVIRSIESVAKLSQKSYSTLSAAQKRQILIVTFEGLTQEPRPVIAKIEAFLKTKKESYMQKILKRERCPRGPLAPERDKKLQNIKKTASKKAFNILLELANDYETKSETGTWVQ